MSELPLVLITARPTALAAPRALELARSGVRMGLIDIDSTGLESLANELRDAGAIFVAQTADVSRRWPLRQAVKEIEAALGQVDVLVACAGFGTLTLVPDLALDTLRQTFEVNLVGVAESIEAVLPGMISRGRGHHRRSRQPRRLSRFPLDDLVFGLQGRLDRLPRGAAARPGATRRHRDDRMPRLRPHRDEHRSSLQAKGQDDRARTGRSTPCAGHPPAPRNCVFPWSMRIGLAILKYMPDRLFDWLMRRAGPEALAVDF